MAEEDIVEGDEARAELWMEIEREELRMKLAAEYAPEADIHKTLRNSAKPHRILPRS